MLPAAAAAAAAEHNHHLASISTPAHAAWINLPCNPSQLQRIITARSSSTQIDQPSATARICNQSRQHKQAHILNRPHTYAGNTLNQVHTGPSCARQITHNATCSTPEALPAACTHIQNLPHTKALASRLGTTILSGPTHPASNRQKGDARKGAHSCCLVTAM
jgi:hypothetical protein